MQKKKKKKRYRNSLFFRLVNFRRKNIRVIKFSDRPIEEIAQRAEEMTCEKETACCVRGDHDYKDIWVAAIGEVLVCSQEPTNAQKFSL